jgi:hypothetical protein
MGARARNLLDRLTVAFGFIYGGISATYAYCVGANNGDLPIMRRTILWMNWILDRAEIVAHGAQPPILE